MKKYLLVLIPILTLLAYCWAADLGAKKLYDVRCPNCLVKQVRAAVTVITNGGYNWRTNLAIGTVTNWIEGVMQSLSATFHCENCHTDFGSPIKPDKFIPTMPATAVEVQEPPAQTPPRLPSRQATTPLPQIVGPGPPPEPERPAPQASELLYNIELPDGSEILVYHRQRTK